MSNEDDTAIDKLKQENKQLRADLEGLKDELQRVREQLARKTPRAELEEAMRNAWR